MRALAVVVHRWVGLVMAGFLLVAGLTGCLLVWYHELDAALNPHLMRVAPPRDEGGAAGPAVLDALVLRERVVAAYPAARVHHLSFVQAAPGDARVFYVEAAPDGSGHTTALPVDEVFVNPYTGAILGARKWGDLGQGLINLMPFLYRLHYSLALDTVGTWAFGIVALLWTLDCFVGAWLTFPARSRRPGAEGRGWWTRWAPAWKVRWRSGGHKLHFDLHRAGGLWPWALLCVLAWSSVAFNLHEAVYRPVMGTVFEFQADPAGPLPDLPAAPPEPVHGWPAAIDLARAHMAELARLKNFRVLTEDRVSYQPRKGYIRYVVRSDLDVNERRGQTAVFVDPRTGALIGSVLPTRAAAGDTVTSWLLALHMAQVWGLPFRIAMTAMGLVVAVLSVTGVVIWWKKRRARALETSRRAALQPGRADRPFA
ncbi:PepSY-associated TM helix domain-containing protein [Hydrogenophaga pseudoflava]|uniref:PepSY-associated TM helix domain-containing protein n=1 Tax=Hydrogenophaga pseudoflava TaxID=47421 RepID=UPI0027E53A68|nr:PepSY-associated TM helix domain-containing protein [Hydrogenophaga pseudoflava]MDQ7743958.1 PepSY-associated TM helix domain-containing protein [Hydrogenophaga pseudoflava]